MLTWQVTPRGRLLEVRWMMQAGREFAPRKLLFKKRMFRETDETILE